MNLNPLSWFRRKKSIGERKLVQLLRGAGWNSMTTNSWASNRTELVNQYRGWSYVAIHAFAECMAEQLPQVAWVEQEKQVKEQLTKAYYSTRDEWKRAKRLAKVRSKYMGRQRRKHAMANIQEGDELIPCPQDDRLVKILRKPNPHDTSWSFNYRLAMWLRLAGGAYIRIVNGNDGLPAELWPIQPNWLRAIGGEKKAIEEYEIQPMLNGNRDEMQRGWMVGIGGRDRIPAEEIVCIGYPHPQHYFDFYSPQEAGAIWVDCGSAMGKSRIAQFQNMSYPGVIIEIDPELEDPDEDEMKRIKARFKAAVSGVANHGEPIVLTKGMTVNPWQRSNLEMDFMNSEQQNRDQLLALHRTGSSVVGLNEQTSFASMIAARANWYQGVIRPTLKLFGGIYTERISPLFQEEGDERQRVIYYDDPTPKDPAQINADMEADYRMQSITPNEVRQERGREAFPYGGDDPMGNMGIGPIPWATQQEDEWLPPPAKEEAPEPGMEQATNGKPETNGHGDTLSNLATMFGRGV